MTAVVRRLACGACGGRGYQARNPGLDCRRCHGAGSREMIRCGTCGGGTMPSDVAGEVHCMNAACADCRRSVPDPREESR